MKKSILIATCTLSLLAAQKSHAQVSVNVQIGAPVYGQSWCNADDDYYYIPQHEVYYNVHRKVYVYPEAGGWMSASCLPARYGGYHLVPGSYYHVSARAPFRNHGYYQNRYACRPAPRPYYEVHNVYYGKGYKGHHDNGNHYGHYKNHDKHNDRYDDRRDDRDNRYADDRHYANDNGRNNDDDRGGRGGYRR